MPDSQSGPVPPPAVMRPVLERGTRAPEAATVSRAPGWIGSLLRIPLLWKLVGANAFMIIAALLVALAIRDRHMLAPSLLTVVGAALLVTFLVNLVLVRLAVQPLRDLDRAVTQIWNGNLDARVPRSILADRDTVRIGQMFNILLDGLMSDRARTRRLAGEVIHAADVERAAIARELHDSIAQSLAALVMQLGATLRVTHDGADPAVADITERVEGAKALATDALEEVRLLSHTMHPRVLDDLGLIAALRRLARETGGHAGVPVDVVTPTDTVEHLAPEVASVLYRVAQEAVRNALRHAAATKVTVRFAQNGEIATLEVIDDGIGFDPVDAERERPGMGLFTMQERVALVDGSFRIESEPGHGASVIASVPCCGASAGHALVPSPRGNE